LITLPTPRPTPGPLPPGYGRLTIIVLDAATFRPVPDTCVVFGSLTCSTMTYQPDPANAGKTILSYRTDDTGRWSLDVPVAATTTTYDMYFFKLGYRLENRSVTLRRGRSVVYTVFLTKTG
jgi:hypothetical protein